MSNNLVPRQVEVMVEGVRGYKACCMPLLNPYLFAQHLGYCHIFQRGKNHCKAKVVCHFNLLCPQFRQYYVHVEFGSLPLGI